MELARRYYIDGDDTVLPRSIATKQAFENAITLDVAMGGSTNTVLHILAAARSLLRSRNKPRRPKAGARPGEREAWMLLSLLRDILGLDDEFLAPVREALRRLEAEGLVTFYPHRGAVVTQLSLDDIQELFEIRAQLEPEILRRAVPRLSRDDLRRARAILDRFASALERGEVAAWGGLNWEFHATLYGPAERPQTLAVIQGLHNNTDRYTRMQLLLSGAIEQAHEEHGTLLSHCGRGEAKEAGRLLKRHITAAGRSLVAFLKDRRAGDTAGDSAGDTMREPS